MILVDVNLLLHAYNPRSADHDRSRVWLESIFSGSELVRLPWFIVWAFLRISTNSRVFAHPLSMAEATGIVSSWFAEPAVGMLEPGDRHWEILQELMEDGQVTGPLVMDAALAAIAIEYGATLHTTDRDFARFPGLKWTNPIAEQTR